MTNRACETLLDAAIDYAEDPHNRAKEDALLVAARAVGYEREQLKLRAEQTQALTQSSWVAQKRSPL